MIAWVAPLVLALLAPAAQAQKPAALILEDFSTPLGNRWKGGLEITQAEGGEKIGQWVGARNGEQLSLVAAPPDWTPYQALDLWLWSATPNNQNVELLISSENPETEGLDYFDRRIVVDWEGWKRLCLPLRALKATRKPAWSHVDSLAFATVGWGIEAKADTDLYLGTIRLLPELPEGVGHRPDVVADFEEDDFAVWSGLARDTEHVKQGQSAGRWQDLNNLTIVAAGLEMDWSPYQFLEFDCWSAAPTGDRFIFCIVSMEKPRERLDYWAHIFCVDWQDWRHFRIPFRSLYKMRSPLGWHRITAIHLYPNGWGMQANPSPDTVLAFDDIRLTKGEPRQMPPGMIDDFEDGPWSWWWMDEGSIPAKSGDHCGQFALHEGWRAAVRTSDPPQDWTPYHNLKLWVYAKQLPGEVLSIAAHGDRGSWTGEVPLDGEGWREATLPLTADPGRVGELTVRVKGLEADDNGKANRDLDPAAMLCFDDLRLE